MALNLHMSLLIVCHIAKGKWFSRRSTNSYKKELFKSPIPLGTDRSSWFRKRAVPTALSLTVNLLAVPDHYPLPVLSELLQSIGKHNTVFTSLDLPSGFWKIPMDDKSREITAFSTPAGNYEWLRLPMGFRNAPFIFQRMVNTLFSGVTGKRFVCVAWWPYLCLQGLAQSSSTAFSGLPEAYTRRS